MLWLYLLGAVTVLIIALRRVLRRLKPLDDELYSKSVAIEHVHSGVAWVRSDGTLGSMNPALAATFGAKPEDFDHRDWLQLFPEQERARIQELYSQMLLAGIASTDVNVDRSDGTLAWLKLVLLAVHDHKMRFVGHHCLTDDRTSEKQLQEREKQLEERVLELTEALERPQTAATR